MLKKVMKKGVVVALACTLTFGTVACGTKTEANPIVIVDGVAIPMEKFDKNYNMVKNMYEMQMGEDVLNQEVEEGVTLRDQVIDEIISQLVTEQIILQDAEKRGIKVEDKEIEETIEGYKEMVGGEEAFNNYLKSNSIELADFKEDVKKMEIAKKQKEAMMKDIKVSEKEEKAYFEEHKAELEQVKARHILIKAEKTDETQDAEAKKKAEEILAEIKNGGDFEAIAKEKSEDTSAMNGGDLGYFGRGAMVKEFDEAAFALEPGQVSELVRSDYGYHIIKSDDKKLTFEELKTDIDNLLKEQKYIEEMEKLESSAKIEIFKDNIKLEEPKEEKKDSEEKEEATEDKE